MGGTLGASATGVTERPSRPSLALRDVPPDHRVLGTPALPEREQKRILLCLEKLPGMRRDLHRIKQQLGMADDS